MNQVFRLDYLRAKVVAFLRKSGPKTVHEVADGLGLPEWAAEAGLKNAAETQLATINPVDQWSIAA